MHTVVKKRTISILLVLITLLGFALRLSFFIGNQFPLHDGGFFYVLIEDLLSNRFVIPDVSSYNQAGLPFVYPPLGLYIVGLIEKLSGADRLRLFRFVPLVVSTLTIPAFYCLAREVMKEWWGALTAASAYALLPMAYKWLILGGGVTRSFGAFFSLLALMWVIRFIRSGGWQAAVLGSLFCGLAVLSHPEWAWFLFYSIGIFILVTLGERQKRVFFRGLLLFLGTAAVVLPWLLTVLSRHGRKVLQPLFDSGFSRWEDFARFFILEWSGELLFPIFTFLSLVGIYCFVKKKAWFLALWLPLVFLLQGRAADQKAVVPLALSAGAGVSLIIENVWYAHFLKRRNRRLLFLILTAVIIYSLVASLAAMSLFIHPMEAPHLESFTWIKAHLPVESKILVISGTDWIEDSYSEWMAALTGRHSVSLVQGYEWLPGFSDRIAQYHQVQYAYSQGMPVLIAWLNQYDVQVDFLVLPQMTRVDDNNWDSEPALHWEDVLLFPGVEKVFENERVLIVDLRGVTGQ